MENQYSRANNLINTLKKKLHFFNDRYNKMKNKFMIEKNLLELKLKQTDIQIKKLKNIEKDLTLKFNSLLNESKIMTRKYREYALNCLELNENKNKKAFKIYKLKNELSKVKDNNICPIDKKLKNIKDKKNEKINLKIELDYYKKKVTCPICNQRERNTLLTKCYHVFCDICVKKTLSSRLRRCPACKKSFGIEGYREVFL